MSTADDTPDYSQYSLAQLLDAKRHIDSQLYPSRAEVLDREIASRPSSADEPSRLSNRQANLLKRGIGIYMFLSGTYSLYWLWNAGVFTPPGDRFAIIGSTIPTLTFASMIFAGACILKNWRIGFYFGLATLSVQIPLFAFGHWAYALSSYPTFVLQLWPPIDFQFWSSRHYFLEWTASPKSFYLGVNIGATLFASAYVTLLGEHFATGKRLRDANKAG